MPVFVLHTFKYYSWHQNLFVASPSKDLKEKFKILLCFTILLSTISFWQCP